MRRTPLPSACLVALDLLGGRRWLVYPGQVTIGGYASLVAACAIAVVLAGFPAPMTGFLLAVALSMLVATWLARFGYSRADVVTLLAILLVGTMLSLPEMARVRDRTAGRRYFPTPIPARFLALVRGEDFAPPF